MPLGVGIGFSQNVDTVEATEEAVKAAAVQSKLKAPRIALLLSTVHYDPKTIITVAKKFLPETSVIGTSTAGIILSNAIKTRGIAVLFLDSDEMKHGISCISDLTAQSLEESGALFAQNSLKEFGTHGRQAFLFFIDGRLENNSLLIKGMQSVFGNIFPVVGAGTSDDFSFNKTFQFYQDKVLRNSAVGIILGGAINVSVASRHGWKPLGKPRMITDSYSNVIKKINNQNAVSLYEEYLGKDSDDIRSQQLGKTALLYPLGLHEPTSQEYLLRNPIEVLNDGSIVCQGDVPKGSIVHVMIGNKESCQKAAHDAALEAKKNLLGKEPKLIIVIESMARLKLFGRGAAKEIEEIKSVFSNKVPIIGLYAHGEVCPFQTTDKFKQPLLQNESITVLAIS